MSEGKKLKIMYIYKILMEKTDENHLISMNEIIEELEDYGITGARKSIYSDINELRDYGVDIVNVKGKTQGYYVASRDFELPELKLLADAVSSARFLTEKKSRALMEKIEGLTSIHEAKEIKRNIYVADRFKGDNEKIYLNVDKINRAIYEGKKITFNRFNYDVKKHKVFVEGDHKCSPYMLTWDNGNYYVVAYYPKYENKLSNFRVDRMDNVNILEENVEKNKFDLKSHLSSTFAMFSGDNYKVTLRFKNKLMNVVIDRFGMGVTVIKDDNEHFIINVDVKTGNTFYGWLMQFSDEVEILSPECVKIEYINRLKNVLNTYH